MQAGGEEEMSEKTFGPARGYRAKSSVAMLRVSGDGVTLRSERPPGRRSVVLLWWAGTRTGRRGRGCLSRRNKLHRRKGGLRRWLETAFVLICCQGVYCIII